MMNVRRTSRAYTYVVVESRRQIVVVDRRRRLWITEDWTPSGEVEVEVDRAIARGV